MITREYCPICDGSAHPIFSQSYSSVHLKPFLAPLSENSRAAYLDVPFEVRWCEACDFAFQTISPDDTDVADLYRLHADEGQIETQISEQKLYSFAHVTEEILVMRQMIANPRPRVLDFGPNWGKWGSMALAFGCEVDAVEVNPITAGFCTRRGINVIRVDDIRPAHYDFINVDQVMEHLSEPVALASRLAGALTNNGMMKWSTPRNSNLRNQLLGAARHSDFTILSPENIDALYPLIHVNLFSNTGLLALGCRVGLECVPLPFFKWLGAGQLWNVPRQIGRNLTVPWKRWRRKGTYLWFKRCKPIHK
jgi:hypothetical protein